MRFAEFGKEKMEILKGELSAYDIARKERVIGADVSIGMDDKAIENKVTELVKSGI